MNKKTITIIVLAVVLVGSFLLFRNPSVDLEEISQSEEDLDLTSLDEDKDQNASESTDKDLIEKEQEEIQRKVDEIVAVEQSLYPATSNLVVEDQIISSDATLEVKSVTFEKPGFIKIVSNGDLGVSELFNAGTYSNVEVKLDKAPDHYGARAYLVVDNGDGVFEQGVDKFASTESGAVLSDSFKISIPLPGDLKILTDISYQREVIGECFLESQYNSMSFESFSGLSSIAKNVTLKNSENAFVTEQSSSSFSNKMLYMGYGDNTITLTAMCPTKKMSKEAERRFEEILSKL